MEIILLEKVKNLGTIGDQVKVRAGYGRNYLIPQGKAVAATENNIKVFEERRTELEAKANDSLVAAKARATQIDNLGTVEITGKASDEGKLYGSIGVREVADAVTAAGVEIGKNEVSMPEGAIRAIGEYEVTAILHPDVGTAIKLSVIAE